jgi:hypothetical protein
VLSHCGIGADFLRNLEEEGLVSTTTNDDREETYPQDAVDQIHNIIVLERLFEIGPRAIRSLYRLFSGATFALPVKDTDLFKYNDSELSTSGKANADLLAVTLKKVFAYLADMEHGRSMRK